MKFSAVFAILSTTIVGALAESHKVHFNNKCGTGTPTLVQNGKVLAKGDYTSKGALVGAVAYLQTGACATNGNGCTTFELTLTNPTSFADISGASGPFHKPYALSFDKCPGISTSCTGPSCYAYNHKADPQVIRCAQNDAGVTITFC